MIVLQVGRFVKGEKQTKFCAIIGGMKLVKDYLERKFVEWRGLDRHKTIQDFAEYLNVSYGALEHWMSGRRNPKRENIAQLAKKLGDEIYDIAGFARPGGDGDLGIDQHLLYLFTRGWKRFPADLQRELEELVSTATEEEAEEIFRDAIRTWRERRNLTDADDDAPDAESPAPEKGAKRRPIQLRQRAASA